MPEIKLEPCPFCGSEITPEIFTLAEIACHDEDEATEFEQTHFAVACNYSRGGCGASTGGICETEEEAAETWNQRAVRHGEWRKCKDGTDFDGETVCSECNGVSPNGWWWKFCPHCGTKMHGGAEHAAD